MLEELKQQVLEANLQLPTLVWLPLPGATSPELTVNRG